MNKLLFKYIHDPLSKQRNCSCNIASFLSNEFNVLKNFIFDSFILDLYVWLISKQSYLNQETKSILKSFLNLYPFCCNKIDHIVCFMCKLLFNKPCHAKHVLDLRLPKYCKNIFNHSKKNKIFFHSANVMTAQIKR